LSDRNRKTTAVVLRESSAGKEVLVFDHPLEEGGVMLQLPAGTIEIGEEPEAAAVRGLLEETGLQGSDPVLAAVQDEVLKVSREFDGCIFSEHRPACRMSGPSPATAAHQLDATGYLSMRL
jgi:8-oxo-dGTP pyrophosphatase MutT (NUDIX family)